jgi:myo-inositol 2-dehydrogenase / D-chiro-inositol 1-dehydrogenase
MITIGFLGCGGIAREYLSRLDALAERARVVAFCDREAARARALAVGREARIYTHGEQMLAQEPLQALFCTLPPYARGDELVQAAQRGLHIFTTKPLALDLVTARRSLAAIEAAGVLNSVGYMFRYSGISERARALVDGRSIALVLGQVIGAMPHGWVAHKALSGGQIVEQSTHLVDMARWFAGDVDEVYVRASTGHVPERIDYEDTTSLLLTFREGGWGRSCPAWRCGSFSGA